MLTLDIPDEVFTEYEWPEDEKPYREAHMPAAVLNSFRRPTVHDGDYVGCTRSRLLQLSEAMEQGGTEKRRKKAARIGWNIEFLGRHGLLVNR